MGRLHATLTSLRRGQIPEYELWRQRTGECDVPELVWQEGSVVDCNWCQWWTPTDTHRAAQLEGEKESTSAYPACKETSRGSPGPVEEKWILSRGISAWRQIARNWFCLNYFMVSKIHFTFMWESHKYRKLFVQFSFMVSGESRPHQNDSSSVQLR